MANHPSVEPVNAAQPTPQPNPQPNLLPRLNEPAPQFSAPSTMGDIRLSDFKGKWVVLFSHPADFTPVCSTELLAFAREQEAFAALDTQLIGLSMDSVYAHIEWLRNLERNFSVRIGYPVIADASARVASLYGMIHPGASSTATVRAVFVIDPQQVLRAMIYYPMTVGRSVAEIKRLVQALRTNADKGLATPEAWQPGQPCIVPPPSTAADADRRVQSNYQVTDWYFATSQP